MFAAGMVLALSALPALAENTIRFSKPVDPELVSHANASVPGLTQRPSVAGGVSAPSNLFSGPQDDLPQFAPVMMVPQTASMKEALNRRDNWTLMTPGEILGVPTAEKILGLPAANGEDKLSPDERFLLRLQRERQTASSALSALRQEDANLLQNGKSANPFGRHDERFPMTQAEAQAQPGSPKYFRQLLNGVSDMPNAGALKPNSPWGAASAQASPWATEFTQPNQLPPSPDQLAGMERFRALMEPISPPDKMSAVTRYAPVVDPNMQVQPSFNPAGRSYEPVRENISRPQGLTPLPGLTGAYSTPVQPAAQAQVPPWMQSGAQPFSLPQRKF